MTNAQQRYLKHQKRKKQTLIEIMKLRHSNRMFNETPLPESDIDMLMDVLDYCPSSCDRKGVSVKVVANKDQKNLLGGLLVGGIGWIHRSSHVLLFFADPETYQAPGEKRFMPYLDGGVIAGNFYLMATQMGLACCFCNPNIRTFNRPHFNRVFNKDKKIFCGAFAIGYPYEEKS